MPVNRGRKGYRPQILQGTLYQSGTMKSAVLSTARSPGFRGDERKLKKSWPRRELGGFRHRLEPGNKRRRGAGYQGVRLVPPLAFLPWSRHRSPRLLTDDRLRSNPRPNPSSKNPLFRCSANTCANARHPYVIGITCALLTGCRCQGNMRVAKPGFRPDSFRSDHPHV